MDPIQEDELKRSLKKRLQQYQDYADQTQKEDASPKTGEMKGKKVKDISATSTTNLFKKLRKE